MIGEFLSRMGLPVTKAGNPILNGSHIGKFQGRISAKIISKFKIHTQSGSPRLLHNCGFGVLRGYILINQKLFCILHIVVNHSDRFVDLASAFSQGLAHFIGHKLGKLHFSLLEQILDLRKLVESLSHAGRPLVLHELEDFE